MQLDYVALGHIQPAPTRAIGRALRSERERFVYDYLATGTWLAMMSFAALLFSRALSFARIGKDPVPGPFVPREGVESCLVQPGGPGALQIAGPAMLVEGAPRCIFTYGPLHVPGNKEALANGSRGQTLVWPFLCLGRLGCEARKASIRAAWLYGALVPEESDLAEPSGNPDDVLVGWLSCWPPAAFKKILKQIDDLRGIDTANPELAEQVRGEVRVVLEDGSSTPAFWYFASDLFYDASRHAAFDDSVNPSIHVDEAYDESMGDPEELDSLADECPASLYQELAQQLRPVSLAFQPYGAILHVRLEQHDFSNFTSDVQKRRPRARSFMRSLPLQLQSLHWSPLQVADKALLATIYSDKCDEGLVVDIEKTGQHVVVNVRHAEEGHLHTFPFKQASVHSNTPHRNEEKVELLAPLTDVWFGSPRVQSWLLLGVASVGFEEGSADFTFHEHQDWGEVYGTEKVTQPLPFVMDLRTGAVVVHGYGKGRTASYGQTIFVGDGSHAIMTRWPAQERLGIIFCHQRRSEIVLLDLSTGVETVLSDPVADFSARSPVLQPGTEDTVVFLSREAVGAHWAGARLRKLTVNPEKPKRVDLRTLVDVVDEPRPANSFPGIYATRLAGFAGSTELILITQWGFDLALVKVDVETRHIERLSQEGESVTDAVPCGPVVIGVVSTVARSGWLAAWPTASSDFREDLTPSAIVLDLVTEKFSGKFGEGLVVGLAAGGPEARARRQLVLYPHGGPHSAFHSGWMVGVSLLVQSSFNVVLANYRGSTGYGEEALESLPGNIGSQDVEDCMAILDHALANGWGDRKRKASLVGGSHGGYLSCMLTALPNCKARFESAVVRNPVTDLPAMLRTSDIEDWVAFEAGIGPNWPAEAVQSASGIGSAALGTLANEDLLKLWAKSPMAYVGSVKARTLLLLGADDVRVPPSQGKQWARQLRQRGRCEEVEVMVFPDNGHALSAPFAEYALWVRTVEFLRGRNRQNQNSGFRGFGL